MGGIARWLAVIRIYTGIFWLLHGIPKILNPHFAQTDGLMANTLREASAGGVGAYHDFLVHTVLPNAPLFGHLVAWGETLTGVSLLLGLLTRLGGLVGVFLPLNYWLMKGGPSDLTTLGGLDWAAMALSFVSLVMPTGLVFGIDASLARGRRHSRG